MAQINEIVITDIGGLTENGQKSKSVSSLTRGGGQVNVFSSSSQTSTNIGGDGGFYNMMATYLTQWNIFSLSHTHFLLVISLPAADLSRHKVSVSSLHIVCYNGKGDQMKCGMETVYYSKYIFSDMMPCSLVGT